MSGALTLRNRQRTRAVDLRRLECLARHLLAEQFQVRHFALGVYLIGARAMTRLNERFLRHGGPTDVITFDYGEPGRPEALCGDIFICLDEAALAARRLRTTWQAELVRYLVHGLLHLRGYDDQTPPDLRRMKRAENRLVKRLAKTFSFRALDPTVAQTSKSAVSRVSRPAGRSDSPALPTGKSAIQQVWKPALPSRRARARQRPRA